MELSSRYNAHEKSPLHFRDEFKRLQKMKPPELDQDHSILDFDTFNLDTSGLEIVGKISKENILNACLAFDTGKIEDTVKHELFQINSNCLIYEHPLHPGKPFVYLAISYCRELIYLNYLRSSNDTRCIAYQDTKIASVSVASS
jgi:hypothetical protein